MPDFLLNPNAVYIILMAGALLALLALATPGTGLLEIGALFLLLVAGYGLYTLSFNWSASVCGASATPTRRWAYELMKRFAHVIMDRLQATRVQLLDMYGQHGERGA